MSMSYALGTLLGTDSSECISCPCEQELTYNPQVNKEVHDCYKGNKTVRVTRGSLFMMHSFYMQDEVTVCKIQKKTKGAEAKQIVLLEALAWSRVAQ